MKREDGVLSIEATVSLSVFVFFMMFLLDFGQIYMAQNYFHHRLLQAGKMVSFYSYDYENAGGVEAVWNDIASMTKFSVGIEADWMNLAGAGLTNFSSCVEKAFDNLSGSIDNEKPDKIMQKLGISDISIYAEKKDSDLDISAQYVIKLRFQFFGIKSITMHQNVKCGLWS